MQQNGVSGLLRASPSPVRSSGFNLAIYMFTMEKSKENKSKSRLSTMKTYDTRPVNGSSATQNDRGPITQFTEPADHDAVSIKEWLASVVYWIKELRWRSRYWLSMRREDE